MVSNKLNDIIPPSRRNNPKPASVNRRVQKKPNGFKRFTFFGISIVALAAIVMSAFYLTSGSYIEVTPTIFNTPVDMELSATKTSQADSVEFNMIVLERVGEQSAKANGKEDAEDRASGQITIYNEYSSKSQRLIKNTRFETADGLIYRIQESVVVPGKDGDTPGKIVATVYADEPGADYNIGLEDFTVPGLKGSPQFDGIYAKSKTPMTGGFKGQKAIVTADEEQKVRGDIDSKLTGDLKELVKSQIPVGYDLLDGSSQIVFSKLTDKEGVSGDSVTLREQGTLYAIVFKTSSLASAIAERNVQGYNGEDLDLGADTKLVISGVSAMDSSEADSITFSIKGNANLISVINTGAIGNFVAGKTKQEIDTAFRSDYPQLASWKIVLRPFWNRRFSTDTGKTQIKVVIPSK